MVAYLRENRNAYMILVIKSEVKRTLGRSRSRWNYITKIDRKEIRYQKQQMHVSV
jgi:DNA-dependent RNA polymerase auxiliary subunit epsilon